ncbi:MAG: response regulator, partial [Lachnospiraceae bacterium]
MYTVIIADDEPVAINMVKKIIEKNRSDFQIVGSAENGEDALELIRQYKPDLIISDIRMPVIDGLALAKETGQISPDSFFILISGFRDFEYARSAIAYGVSDYLLKPITPTNLLCSIKAVVTKVDERNYQKQKLILTDLCNGTDTDNEIVARFLPYSAYYIALIRYNGLPTRFSNHPNQ